MSRNFSLFPIRKLQRCPRYIPHDVAQSIRRLDVCRLHERVDVNDFKHTFLMGRANAVASFRDGPSVFGNHLILLSTSLSCAVSHCSDCYIRHSYWKHSSHQCGTESQTVRLPWCSLTPTYSRCSFPEFRRCYVPSWREHPCPLAHNAQRNFEPRSQRCLHCLLDSPRSPGRCWSRLPH